MSTVLENPGVTPASPAAPGPAVPASPADGSVGASPTPPPESQGLRQLREQYETTKQQLDRWNSLGKHEDVSGRYQVAQTLFTEANELGEHLGYDSKDIQAAFQKDPIQTLNLLRQRAAQQEPRTLNPKEIKDQLQKIVDERLKPVTEWRQQEQIREAETRVDVEFNKLFTTEFKDGLPDDCRQAIRELMDSSLGDDQAACQRLMQGQTADIARHFQDQKTKFLKIVNSYVQHERKRTGDKPSPTPGAPPEAPKSRMDQKLSNGKSVKELFGY